MIRTFAIKIPLFFVIITMVVIMASNASAQSRENLTNLAPMAACNAGTAVASTITPCSGETVDFTNPLSGSTGSNQHDWYQKIGAAAYVKVSVGNSKNYTTGALTWPNVYQYYMQAAPGSCAGAVTSNTITVTPAQAPTTAAAGADQLVCTATATLAGNSVAGGETGAWTKISGTGTITTPSSPTSGLTGLGGGDNVFRWTITLGSCTSSDDVTIPNAISGITAYASTNCPVSTTSAILSILPTTASYTSMKWQQSDNGGAYADIGGATTTPYTATLVAGHTYTYKALLTNACGTFTTPPSTAAVTPYSMQDYTGGNVTYATADAASHCYNNLTAGQKYCFAFIYFNDLEIDWLPDGCASCNLMYQDYNGGGSNSQTFDAANGCTSTQGKTGNCATSQFTGGACVACAPTMYDNSCGVVVSNGWRNGPSCAAPALTEGNVYHLCFTVPAGCGGMSMCPQVKCTAGACAATPLPIKLLSFTATPLSNKVQLKWETATETNNDYFTLYRSENAVTFEEIGKVKGAGNSTSYLYYEFQDKNPLNGISYYQLKQTDFDGKNESSQIVAVDRDFLNPLKLIYFTPDESSANLKYQITTTSNRAVSVSIVDVLGNVTISKAPKFDISGQDLNVDISSLTKGIYLFKVTDGVNVVIKKFFY